MTRRSVGLSLGIALIILICSANYYSAAQDRSIAQIAPVVRAQRFELVNENGETMVTLMATSSGKGHASLSIRMGKNAMPCLRIEQTREDLLMVNASADGQHGHFCISLWKGGQAELMLGGNDIDSYVQLGVGERLAPYLRSMNDGKSIDLIEAAKK